MKIIKYSTIILILLLAPYILCAQTTINETNYTDYDSITSLPDSLREQIANATLKLESLEEKDAINELEKQQIINKLKQEKHIRIFIIIIIIILLIFVVVLYNALRRIKRLNKLLTERNEDVWSKQKSLEEENKIRTKLLSILSHDLRTPLSAVYLFLQVLRSKTLPPEMVEKHLIKLEASLNSSFQMLDNMLYWTKSQINGIKCNPEVVDIVDSISITLDFLSTNIQNKSIEIINNTSGIIYIYADREMVNIILRNIIANAIKFTPQNGKITISYKKDKTFAVISIADTGVGISKEQQENLFSPKVISQTGTAKETGSGLGLILVHDFIKLCRGKISFKSKENEGTTFFISLPLAEMEQLKQKSS